MYLFGCFLTPFLAPAFLLPMVDFLGCCCAAAAAAVGDMDRAASTLGPWSELSAFLLMAMEL